MLVLKSIVAAVTLITLSISALAGDAKVGPIEIHKPWTRATPTGAKVAGGFMTIRNSGKTSDRLIGGSFARSAHVEIHEMAMQNDVMRMRELPKGLEIQPGSEVTLRPGSYHVMFMELTGQLKQGETVAGTLRFEKAGEVHIVYEVGTMGKRHMKQGNHAGHGMSK